MAKKVVVSLDRINWDEATNNLQWAILLRLASGKPIQKDAIENTFNRIWRLNEATSFQKVERDTLLVTFKSREDQERVLVWGPWTFEGTALLLQKWEAGMSDEDFECTSLNIWVQLHKLPYEFRRKECALALASLAGVEKESSAQEESQNEGRANEYMNV